MDARTLARWESKVRRTSSCWLWADAPDAGGYGKLHVGDRWLRAARLAYEHFVAEIPPGCQIDHLCRNRLCVRPSHLEAVSPRTNILRSDCTGAVNSRKTHCIRGHEFTPENTGLVSTRRGGFQRRCRACRVIRGH